MAASVSTTSLRHFGREPTRASSDAPFIAADRGLDVRVFGLAAVRRRGRTGCSVKRGPERRERTFVHMSFIACVLRFVKFAPARSGANNHIRRGLVVRTKPTEILQSEGDQLARPSSARTGGRSSKVTLTKQTARNCLARRENGSSHFAAIGRSTAVMWQYEKLPRRAGLRGSIRGNPLPAHSASGGRVAAGRRTAQAQVFGQYRRGQYRRGLGHRRLPPRRLELGDRTALKSSTETFDRTEPTNA